MWSKTDNIYCENCGENKCSHFYIKETNTIETRCRKCGYKW